ncbi:hypothetical protein NEOLEDRAFT_1128991 [Neolentinus lepideus HHB14362 ss-1]|uniref:Uncharacterized protein n=1 Tax=Neolentinus lepideus HHB14362 ss-1 TaxID=1314782 RepID=A0A165UVV0_9AGAM|nr:hypothetical protein NEOLEDRAFT_1128991 [Neolentinus lepideus HHB14362 ss-1]
MFRRSLTVQHRLPRRYMTSMTSYVHVLHHLLMIVDGTFEDVVDSERALGAAPNAVD